MKAKITRYYYDDTRPTIRDFIECYICAYDGIRNKYYWSLQWRMTYETINIHCKLVPENSFDAVEELFAKIKCLQTDGYKIQFESVKMETEKGDVGNEKL